MKKIRHKLFLAVILLSWLNLSGFSPYENFLQSGKPRQVGLIAAVPEDSGNAVVEILESLATARAKDLLAASGITNLAAYQRTINDRNWLVLHFVLDGGQDYLEAARVFSKASRETADLARIVEPHPRAERFGTRWLQMEWINYIRGRDVDDPAASKLMIVTTIIPEREEQYRTLHQTVWPGVADQVARSNSRDLCIFLAEIDGLLVEFLHVEYVGDDQKADDEMSQTEAINHRWWKLTDACQKGLPGVDGNWTAMEPVPERD